MGNAIQATAGTLESSDIFITIAPGPTENVVTLDSIVMRQFGQSVLETIEASLAEFGLTGVTITAKDRGALNCTIKARMEAAIVRYKEQVS